MLAMVRKASDTVLNKSKPPEEPPRIADESSDEVVRSAYIGSFRWKVFQTFENPDYKDGPWPKPTAKVISLVVMATILVSTLAFILESEACTPSSFLHAKPALPVLLVIEVFSVSVFSLEYVSRLLSCPKPCAFFWTPLNLIDLLAILPFYLGVILREGELDPYECRADYDAYGNFLNASQIQQLAEETAGSGVPNLGFLRVVRLVRIFRVFKFGRYSLGLQMFIGCLKNSTQPLGILAVIAVIASTVFGAIINIFEASDTDYSPNIMHYLDTMGRSPEVHDLCFGTIIRGYWWAVVTMTTVGYGDCFPVTPMGKIITAVTMIFGILSLALPITVIGSNFAKMVEVFAEEAAELGAADLDGTGNIDEFELRTFLAQKKKENSLVPGADTNPGRLMARYDEGEKGYLISKEFQRLQEDIVNPQDKAMGTLEQVGISVAYQEETSRQNAAQMQALRVDFDRFVTSQDTRLKAIENMLLAVSQQMVEAKKP